MSAKAMAWAKSQKTGSPTLKFVLVALAFHADEAGKFAEPQRVLVKATELTERTVRKALQRLEAGGFLRRVPQYGSCGSRGPDVIWLRMRREGCA